MPNKNIKKRRKPKTKSFAFYVNSLKKSLKKDKKKSQKKSKKKSKR
tara:strand:- start:532 stop:669 length:138 start_codon:yes stop_codon:yes gene_type:complete